MAEYIDREALKRKMTFGKEDILLTNGKTFVNFDCVSEAVLNTPAADVAEVRALERDRRRMPLDDQG